MAEEIKQDKKEVIVLWVNDSFKKWLKKYELILEIISDNLDDFKLSITSKQTRYDFTLSKDDLEEIYLSIIEKREEEIKNKYNIDSIFSISKNQYVTFISSANETELKPFKTTLFLDSKQQKKVNLEFTNKLTYTILYILVQNDCFVNFDATSFGNVDYLNQLFNIIFLSFDFKDLDIKEDKSIIIIISAVFELNQILKTNLIPLGITQIVDMIDLDLLQDKIKIKDVDEESEEEETKKGHHLLSYDIEALAYFFAAEQNEDYRFRYLDYYHVLEYFFDRIILDRTVKIIKESIKNPNLFYEDLEVHNFAKRLKEEIVGDERKQQFRELEILNKIFSEFMETNYFDDIKKEYTIFKGMAKEIPSVSLNNKDPDKIKTNFSIRIYGIRNSIAHSKSEFTFRITPTSDILKNKADLIIVKNIAHFLIRKFSNNFII